MYDPLTGENKEDGQSRLGREVANYNQTRQAESMDHKMEALRAQVAAMQAAMGAISSTFTHIIEDLDKLVSRSEFDPVRYIVYGACFSALAGMVFYTLSKALLK